MLRRTVSIRASHVENIARGLSRVASAWCPCTNLTSIFPSASSSVSSGSGMGTFQTRYTDTSEAAATSAAGGHSAALSAALQPISPLAPDLVAELSPEEYQRGRQMRHRAVPATRVARAAGFTSLFLQLSYEKVLGSSPKAAGAFFSSTEYGHIVDTLCRMRGSVLKLGQMLSIQDEHTIPPHVTALFDKVRDNAFAMPTAQLHKTLAAEWKREDWREAFFSEFDDNPIAAASIGQVHYGRLNPDAMRVAGTTINPTAFARGAEAVGDSSSPREVAVKVQYPGVARSINSDVANLRMLMSFNFLPSGMFVDKILEELRNELSLECQYTVEASKQRRYKQLVDGDPALAGTFHVPEVIAPLSTNQVLVSEFVRGIPIDRIASRTDIPQELRNRLADKLMLLTLKELFEWQFMQTDPNFANFLFDAKQGKLQLLDFGAAREYPDDFIRDYLEVVAAAGRGDREEIVRRSISLGFLTGREVPEMIDAHVSSVLLLGRCFSSADAPYDFSKENLPQQIQAYVPTMIKLRLKPPPTPVYSLHRRLSGTILIATKLRATVNSGPYFWSIYERERARLSSTTS